MGSIQSKLAPSAGISSILIDDGVSSYNKFRKIDYSCHELLHTWSPSCSEAMVEVGGLSFKEGLKIYTSVYVASLLFRGKLPTIWDILSLVANVVQSSLFLGCNAGGYVTFICAIRRIFGGHNWYSLGYLSSWPASLSAIFIERQSRRGALAIYVCYVATEAILETYRRSGTLPNIPGLNNICFGVMSSILIYIHRTKLETSLGASTTLKKKTEAKDVVFSLLGMIVGKEECYGANSTTYNNLKMSSSDFGGRQENFKRIPSETDARKLKLGMQNTRSLTSMAMSLGKAITLYTQKIKFATKNLLTLGSLDCCPHGMKTSCLYHILKGFAVPFVGGNVITLALNVVRAMMKRKSIATTMFIIFGKHNFELATFLGAYGGVFKLISCFLRGVSAANRPLTVAAPAGFFAGISSMALYGSTSISIYTAWKTIDIVLKEGVASGRLPAIPFCTEIAYATATAVLFHFGVTEPESLKPSYFGFLNRITENRMTHLNRYLVDYEYGGIASRLHGFAPKYENDAILSERMKKVWPTILHEKCS